jgi:prephenate dehydrogenase
MPRIIPVEEARPDAGAIPPFARIAIVGCGLIGGSIGLAARRRWPSALLIAVDRKDVLEAAMRAGAADVAADDLGMVSGAELILLAAPVRQNIALLGELADHIPEEAVVSDVGSSKRAVVDAAATLPPRFRFVGGHPLAGAAVAGIGAARPDLFDGRPWLLTPTAGTDAAAVERLEQFVSGLGAAPARLDPDEHDRLLAYLSHLPQVVVSALMHVVGGAAGAGGLALAGRGLRDTTRLATSPPDIWRDVLATNPDHVASAIDRLIESLQAIRPGARTDDDAVERVFTSAARWKRVLEG